MLDSDEIGVDETPLPSRFRVDPDRRAHVAERRSLRRDLSAATRAGDFLLHLQPRVSLLHGRPSGAEALVRWPHRKRGMLSPAVFLPLAEETGHIVEIGGWVMRQACREAADWPSGLGVSVNVSPRQLHGGALATQIAEALDHSGLDPECLALELSETTLIELRVETILTLSAIRDLGVGLTLGEFGAGLASLTALRRLPLTAIKIDRGLTRATPSDGENAAMLSALVALGHALKLTVIAVGIETEAQRAYLTQRGCDEGQGSLFSQPLPPRPARDLMTLAGSASGVEPPRRLSPDIRHKRV